MYLKKKKKKPQSRRKGCGAENAENTVAAGPNQIPNKLASTIETKVQQTSTVLASNTRRRGLHVVINPRHQVCARQFAPRVKPAHPKGYARRCVFFYTSNPRNHIPPTLPVLRKYRRRA
jgi:hypothetical protein